MTLRGLVADDQAMVRAGFRLLLAREPDIEVESRAGDGRPTVRLSALHLPEPDRRDPHRGRAGHTSCRQALHAKRQHVVWDSRVHAGRIESAFRWDREHRSARRLCTAGKSSRRAQGARVEVGTPPALWPCVLIVRGTLAQIPSLSTHADLNAARTGLSALDPAAGWS